MTVAIAGGVLLFGLVLLVAWCVARASANSVLMKRDEHDETVRRCSGAPKRRVIFGDANVVSAGLQRAAAKREYVHGGEA